MVSNIHDDRMELTSKVEEALRRLVGQTLVQKHGELYVFLTNEEQEINQAIKSQNIDSNKIVEKASDLIFEELYRTSKYIYPAFNGRYAIPFNRIVDNRLYKQNQNHDISVKILTPDSDELSDISTLRGISLQDRTVLVVLPEDRSFLDEIRLFLQIEEFMRKDMGNSITKYNAIKEAKSVELRERKEAAQRLLTASLQEATIYVEGEILSIKSKDISTRMDEAVGKLVAKVYDRITHIDTAMNEKDIENLFKAKTGQLTLDGIDRIPNKYALDDVREYIATNTQRHVKTSMKSVIDRFVKAPYGFVEADVHWLVAKLFKEGDVALFVNNEAVTIHSKSVNEIILYLTRKVNYEKLMLETRERANEKQKKVVKEVMKKLFGLPLTSDDDDVIMKRFLEYATSLHAELDIFNTYCTRELRYPGKETIQSAKKMLAFILQLKYSKEFFSSIYAKRDEYLDFAEEYEDIKKFFQGEQKNIFDDAIKSLDIYEDSKVYIVDEETKATANRINEIIKQNNPYGNIHKLPELVSSSKINTIMYWMLVKN